MVNRRCQCTGLSGFPLSSRSDGSLGVNATVQGKMYHEKRIYFYRSIYGVPQGPFAQSAGVQLAGQRVCVEAATPSATRKPASPDAMVNGWGWQVRGVPTLHNRKMREALLEQLELLTIERSPMGSHLSEGNLRKGFDTFNCSSVS